MTLDYQFPHPWHKTAMRDVLYDHEADFIAFGAFQAG